MDSIARTTTTPLRLDIDSPENIVPPSLAFSGAMVEVAIEDAVRAGCRLCGRRVRYVLLHVPNLYGDKSHLTYGLCHEHGEGVDVPSMVEHAFDWLHWLDSLDSAAVRSTYPASVADRLERLKGEARLAGVNHGPRGVLGVATEVRRIVEDPDSAR